MLKSFAPAAVALVLAVCGVAAPLDRTIVIGDMHVLLNYLRTHGLALPRNLLPTPCKPNKPSTAVILITFGNVVTVLDEESSKSGAFMSKENSDARLG